MGDILKNIISFGAHGRIKKAQESYEETYNRYEELKSDYELKNSEIKVLFEELIIIKMKVQKNVKKMEYILPVSEKKRNNVAESNNHIDVEQLDYVSNSLESGDILMNSIKGTGIALSLGASAGPAALWLVGNFGVASTGAAISSLSGAAATNAALAALGGGAVAAGGGGMAAGATVLAALGPMVGVGIGAIALPLFSHLSANKKIKEIGEIECEILNAIDELEAQLLKLDVYKKRTNELMDSLNKGIEAFNFIYKKTKKELFPLGFISKIFRKFKFIIKNKKNEKNQIYYSEKEWVKINSLLKTAQNLLVMRDKPVVDIEKN